MSIRIELNYRTPSQCPVNQRVGGGGCCWKILKKNINRIKEKIMIISIDVINPFFPSPILVHDNDVQKTLNERDFLNIMQGIYQKLLASVIVTLKYRKTSPRSETRQECLLLLQVHNFVLEFIARKIRCEKNKSHPMV